MIKPFSILLLAVMGLAIFGTYPALQVLRYQAKAHTEDSIRHHPPLECQTIFENMHENKLVDWEETDKEFHYKGKMYDVVRIKMVGGTRLYYCLCDDNEAKICALVNIIVNNQQNDPQSATKTHKLLKLFVQVFTPGERYQHTEICQADRNDYLFRPYAGHYSRCYLPIAAPPPWHA